MRGVRGSDQPGLRKLRPGYAGYKESVLPAAVTKRVVVEAGVTDSWWKYAGSAGKVIGLDRFGESAPAGQLFKLFGFTPENVASTVESIL